MKVSDDVAAGAPFGGADNLALLKAEATAADTAAAVANTFNADTAKDGDLWTTAFSAGDAVCKTVVFDFNVRTLENSSFAPGPTSSSATTCTGGWTAWTDATKWT